MAKGDHPSDHEEYSKLKTDGSSLLATTAYLPGLSEFCHRRHVDLPRLLAQVGLPLNTFDQSFHLISQRKIVLLFNLIVNATKNPLLGLQIGGQFQLGNIGLPGILLTHQPKIINLYPIMQYLYRTQSAGSKLILSIRGKRAFHQVKYFLPPDIPLQYYALMSLAGARRLIQQLAGGSMQLKGVHFTQLPGKNAKPIEEWFGCPCIAPSDIYALEFSSDLLYQKPESRVIPDLPQKKWLSNAVTHYPDLEQLIISIVEHLIRYESCTIEQVADMLGIHLRVFHKCLQARGLTFREIVETTKGRIATELMVDTGLSIQDIGNQLGYTNPPAFTRAFKRWYGVTPAEWRKCNKG